MSHPWLFSHAPSSMSTSSSSPTYPTTQREPSVPPAHLQAPSVDKLRHQESLWREDLQSGGNPRTTTPTFQLWQFLILKILLLLLRFLFRHLHEILPLIRCHHRWVLHLDSELSLNLQAHCSAILVSRLLTLLLKTLLGIVTLRVFADFTSRFR